jgi:hypothetical protein
LFPNFPNRHQKNLHKECSVEIILPLCHHIEKIDLQIPIDSQPDPTLLTEKTLEEKMEICFLTSLVTEDTRIIIIINFVVSPFQHISRVYSIPEQQPYKDFQFVAYL